MRAYLLLFLFLNAFMAVGASTVSVRLDLVDAITKEPVSGIRVRIKSGKGEELANELSDHKGKVYVEIEMKKQENEITVDLYDEDDTYRSKSITLYKGRTSLITCEINMGPTDLMYELWYTQDDQLYGGIHARSLSDEMNSNGLISGCFLDELEESSFPGGMAAMQHFITENLRYPQESIEMNEQGKVYMCFIIEEDGQISHIKIERGVSPTLDAEAYRLIRNFPKWEPASCRGEAVRICVRLPVNFTLH